MIVEMENQETGRRGGLMKERTREKLICIFNYKEKRIGIGIRSSPCRLIRESVEFQLQMPWECCN